jgi:hypothetical protein
VELAYRRPDYKAGEQGEREAPVAIGGNIVRLNIIRSNPRMRSTTVQFIGFTLA